MRISLVHDGVTEGQEGYGEGGNENETGSVRDARAS